ncbi:gag/pol protein [Cucumis melo var. makuwa]|uniref:Gag/pol protein n=1 Tax=Cucumis melo var. makuwa TaxID=1194695 RepID=A0A5A7U945_CUCMM|nr:gag/pol protein [Cucumis melo var. makuwa]
MMIHFNIAEVNGVAIDETNQVSFILDSLSKSFIPFQTNASLNKIEFNLTTFLNELQRFQNLTMGKGKEVEANDATTKRNFSRGSSSKFKAGPSKPNRKIEKKGNGKTPKQNKGKKTIEKGKCYHYSENGHWLRNYPKYLAQKKAENEAQENSSWKRLSKGKITLKVGIGEMISAKAVGDLKLFFNDRYIMLKNVLIRRLVKNGLLSQLEDNSLPPCDSYLEGKMTKRSFTGKAQIVIPDNGIKDPLTYKQAMNDVDCDQWVKAMDLEMESMYSNSVWTLVDQSNDVKPIGCKWIYKRIRDQASKVQTFKARLVAKGYLTDIKKWLATQFQMKDLENAQYVLGIEIVRNRKNKTLAMSQTSYIDKMLSRYKMQNSKKSLLPYRYGIHLSKEQCPKTPQEVKDMSNIPYASAVGSLMYAMLCTRPDICYSVGIVSRYQSNPGSDHWTAVKNILKYLRRTKDYMLVYGSKDLILTRYTDSDFQSDKDVRKSTSESVFTLNGEAVVWKRIKQSCIADSTMEAEYVASCEAAKEAVWLKKFLTDLEIVPNIHLPITLYCDNSGAVANSQEPRSHKRRKHIERKYHLIREIIHRGDVTITKISSEQNITDPFTKALTAKVFESHLHCLEKKFWNEEEVENYKISSLFTFYILRLACFSGVIFPVFRRTTSCRDLLLPPLASQVLLWECLIVGITSGGSVGVRNSFASNPKILRLFVGRRSSSAFRRFSFSNLRINFERFLLFQFGCGVDKVNDHAIPRMLRWVCQQSPKSQTISQVFDSPMSKNGGSKRVREVVNDEDDFKKRQLNSIKSDIDELKSMMSTILKHIGLQRKVSEGLVDHTLESKEMDNAKTEDVDTGGTPNWLRMPKEDEHIELKKKGDEDVLEKNVDIGLEEPIDVIDNEVQIEDSGKKLRTHFDEDVIEIEPFLTQRPHVRPTRRKRASVYLSTPFTTLPKRSVTSTTSTSQSEPIVYHPMHKILDVHLDRLRAWITDKCTDDEVRETFHGKKSKVFFRDLFMYRRWLADEHLDALFLFIRLKIKAAGIPSSQNFTTADTIFMLRSGPYTKNVLKRIARLTGRKSIYRLVDYVVGSKEDFQDPWASVDYVYSPFNVHGWVLLCLDLVSCQVKVWDSLPSLTTAEDMTNILLPIRELVPKLLDSTGFFDRRGRSSTYKELWPVVIVDSIPLQRNNSDCGVFTIKYFEYIAAGVGLDTLCQENMSYFRKQLAFQLWINTPMY